jgi:hypothetical protein
MNIEKEMNDDDVCISKLKIDIHLAKVFYSFIYIITKEKEENPL